nr:uncharacterized protein LOC127304113 [Lolium perenne]
MWQMLDKFCAEVVDSFSDEESDQSMQTLATTAASMIHEFNSNQGPVHRGSVKGRSKNLPRNRVEGQLRLHTDYFHLTDPVYKEKMFRRRLMQDKTPRVSYEVNGNEYDKPYYLADSIYPDWATLVKTVRCRCQMAWSLAKPQGLFRAQQQTARVAARDTVWRRCAALLSFFVSRKR